MPMDSIVSPLRSLAREVIPVNDDSADSDE
jgi:hypothetical protein